MNVTKKKAKENDRNLDSEWNAGRGGANGGGGGEKRMRVSRATKREMGDLFETSVVDNYVHYNKICMQNVSCFYKLLCRM